MAVRSPLASPGRRIMLAVTATAVAGTLPVFLVGALAVQIRADLHFGPSVQGALASMFFGTVAIGALPCGTIADRIGWWRAIRITGTTLAVVMCAIAVGARSWILLA